jgi:hypothetical protein
MWNSKNERPVGIAEHPDRFLVVRLIFFMIED